MSVSSTTAGPGDTPCRVLIVEDEALVAMSLSFMVEDLEHEVCGVASSGPQAIEQAGQSRPTVALVDVGLKGGMDGIQTAGALNGLGVPSIILSGDASDEALRRAAQAGVLDYVLKPYSIDRLREAFGKVPCHV